MLKLSIALVALSAGLLVGSVRAAEVPGIVPPPAVYDHKPTMPIEEHILPLEQVKDFCRHHWNIDPKGSYNGCALSLSGGLKCIVYRIADDRVRRHEYGHCNGWPPDHSVAAAQKPQPVTPTQPAVLALKPWPTDPPAAPLSAVVNTKPDPIFGVTRILPK